MARIIGVEVPPGKRIDIALRYIYGIGPVNAKEILERANIDPSIRAKDLTEQQLAQIVHAIQEVASCASPLAASASASTPPTPSRSAARRRRARRSAWASTSTTPA